MNGRDIASFRQRKVLVVGDVMLDKYIWGDVTRISPEAPVPIIHVRKEEHIPGGASNVAANIAALEGSAILCGVIGKDEAARALLMACERGGIRGDGLVSTPDRPTTQKIRLMGGRQQLLRLDFEDAAMLPPLAREHLLEKLRSLAGWPEAIVVSDYAKGVISETVMNMLRTVSQERGIPLITDGKPGNLHWFHDITLIKPNLREAAEMSGISVRNDEDLARMGNLLRDRQRCSVLITMGDSGMALFETGKEMVRILTKPRGVFDVAGAGDTVAAVLALAMSAGFSVEASARLANAAAGIVVTKIGTASVTPRELAAAISNGQAHHA